MKKIALLLGLVAVAFGVCWAQEEESGRSAHTVPGGGEEVTFSLLEEIWTFRRVGDKTEINPAFIAALREELGLGKEKDAEVSDLPDFIARRSSVSDWVFIRVPKTGLPKGNSGNFGLEDWIESDMYDEEPDSEVGYKIVRVK